MWTLITNRKNICLAFILAIVLSILYCFITTFLFFPKSIKIVEGKPQFFNFGIPLSATIEPDNINALSVNQKPIEENITINLSEGFTLESAESGHANMTLNAFGMPVKKVNVNIMPDTEVIPCGFTVGVRIDTEGVMVLGTGYVSGRDGVSQKPSEGILKSGDIIIYANDTELKNKEQLIDIIKSSDKEVKLKIKRNEETIETRIKTIKSALDETNKIGVWVRDGTKGIGTITYYNPETGKFGALGHGIIDIDTKRLMSVKTGEISESEISSIKKGKKGIPGELVGDIKSNIIGKVKINTALGIYGTIDSASASALPKEKMKIALQTEIHEGPAIIKSNIEGKEVKSYDIYIESVNRFSNDDSKGMVIRITDQELLSKTGGIVQGMSGSPIIQDDKLIGAVTHVFVQDPSKGYGIFIENMLHQEIGI